MSGLIIRHISSGILKLSNLFRHTRVKQKAKWTLHKHIQFAEKDGVKLHCDVYVPRSEGAKGAVLIVHGGGWSSRSREDTQFYSEQLAGQGLVAVNCTYRLAPEHIYPSAVEDVRDAYHWMIEHAEDFQIDREKIGAMGYSAGAHLISLVAAWSSQKRDGYKDIKFKVVVCGGGVYDFMVYPLSPYINRFTTFYRDENISLYQNASPLHQLGDELPHFFLYHAQKDALVEHDQMERFAKAIKEKGGSVETYTVPRLSHIYTFIFSIKSLEKAVETFKRFLN
jgi:acetyl esterase/lipase